MTTLLTFRKNVREFYSRYDYIITPILKCILALMVFTSLKNRMNYLPVFENMLLLVLLSVVCAFLPVEFIVGIGAVMMVLQSFKVSIDIAVVTLAFVLIFYCGYMRFVSKTGIIVLLIPILYTYHLMYAVPIVLGFLVGPAAIIPVIFGIILYYYQQSMGDLVNVLAASTEEETMIQGYHYVISALLDNRFMILTCVVFACVILITYIIYRASFTNSWIVAFAVGGFLNVILFLIGSVTLDIEIEIVSILLGSLAGIFVAMVIQFGKGFVDYQRTELLQFEDDDYYYYVKAIPKLSVSESNKNIKRINSKTHN